MPISFAVPLTKQGNYGMINKKGGIFMQKINRSWWHALFFALLFVIGYKIIDRLPQIMNYLGSLVGVISPFIIGGIIAFFLYRPVKKVEHILKGVQVRFIQKRARGFSIATVYILFLAVCAFVIGFLIEAIYKNIADIIANWDTISTRAMEIFNMVSIPQKHEWLDKINAFLSGLMESEMILKAGNIVGGVASSIISAVTGFIVSIYMIVEKESLEAIFKKITHRMFKGERVVAINKNIRRTGELFYSYFTGLALDAIVIGAISVVFYIIFNAPYPWLLGIIIAIGNMIPFFGPIVATILVTVIALIALGPMKALWILIFQLILGQVDGNLIQPKIVGSSVGISPFWVIFAVIFFGGIFGPVGMLLGVPIVAVCRMMIINTDSKQ